MKIIKGYPPNYAAILKVFPQAASPGVIFCYGESLFNPSGRPISDPLLRHEETHAYRQQVEGIDAWWDRYLRDPQWRFVEEEIAHIVEWKTVLAGESNRANRRAMLPIIAKRLSGPLYGNLITFAEAKRLLKKHGDFKENEV